MNGSRRHLLAASGGLVASLGGCLSSLSDERVRADAPESSDREPTDSTTTELSATVRVTTTVDREDLEYVPSNDTVRYVAAWRTNRTGETITREPVYETIPFEEWAEVECASVAAKRVSQAMSQRLDGEDDGIAVGVTAESGKRTVLVEHQTRLNRDGDVISEPAVSYERVKQVAPERVMVGFSFASRTRECTVGVTTRQATIRQQ